MVFPATVLPIKQELLIDGTWTDVTPETRSEAAVAIRRGYSGEQANLSAASCDFTLDNRDGAFSNRNPLSPYYRLLGRNTQFRTSVTESVRSLRLGDYSTDAGVYDGARVWTADKAVLDITGDIDIRVDVEPDNWYGADAYFLASKYLTTTNNRSWTFYVSHTGYPNMIWSTDGTTSGRVFASATEPVPDGARLALRATIDVNNGAAGNTVTFYTAPTIAGSWTQLGDPVIQSGVTSIFSSSANVEVGTVGDGGDRGSIINPVTPFIGRVYAFELYSGIAGTRVANMDATSRSNGDTSWSDGLATPNTWTVTDSAEISDADYRFWGEVPKFAQRSDTTGRDIYTPTTAADVLQRMMQGSGTLNSPIYRNLIRADGLTGYWPMEGTDGTSQSRINAAVGRTGYLVDGSFSSDVTLPGSSGVLNFSSDDGYASGQVKNSGALPSGTMVFLWYFKLETVPVSTIMPINFYLDHGMTYRIDFQVSATTYILTFRDGSGASMDSSTTAFGAGAEPDQWIAMRVEVNNSGLVNSWEWGWYPVGGSTLYGTSGSYVSLAETPRSFISYPYTGKSGLSLAHVALFTEDLEWESYAFVGSTNGYQEEPCDERFGRLCREEGLPYWIVGRKTGTSAADSLAEPMDTQRAATLVNLLLECVELDGGLMYGPRDKFGLAFRLRRSIRNRAAALTLDYSANHLSGVFEPDEDDALIRNDCTVTRPSGGFARAVQETGPLNIQGPQDDPDGVGIYSTSVSRSVYDVERLPDFAEDEKFFGTWDELRYKKVQVQLARAPFTASAALTAQVRRLNLGDRITITDLPSWLPPGDVDLMSRGYNEKLQNFTQDFTWNTMPYGPYLAVNDLSGSEDSHYRVAATNTVLAEAVSSSATSLILHTPTGKLWRRSSGAPTGTYPMNVTIAGEVVSATALANVTLSFVAVGTVAHNTSGFSTTPGLPAGLATGDLCFTFAAIRNTAATVNTPTDWTAVASSENVSLFARIAPAGMAAPTVTYTGGVAGDDTTAQIVAFRPSSALLTTADLTDFVSHAEWQTNTSAQDIIYPPGSLVDPVLDDSVALYLGWKQDDWTSVASPGTEIAEPDTTTGNDHGLVWAYTIQTTATRIAQGSFVVTGGASAVSKGAVIWINPRHQLMTATRSQNSIVKAQIVFEDVQVTEPFYVAR